jgi:hypothetical protein
MNKLSYSSYLPSVLEWPSGLFQFHRGSIAYLLGLETKYDSIV